MLILASEGEDDIVARIRNLSAYFQVYCQVIGSTYEQVASGKRDISSGIRVLFFFCFIQFSFFLSFLLAPSAQMNACTAVERIMRAKLPEPCLDRNARPGALRHRMLTATFLPSKSPWGSDSMVTTLPLHGAFRVI